MKSKEKRFFLDPENMKQLIKLEKNILQKAKIVESDLSMDVEDSPKVIFSVMQIK